ncbi:MAG: prenyltransferase [Candidatus Dormibacteraeota bacterium]|uniref:Prenyltransferase n=1 Tax=Candidatus Amunia macphersoniae TaxID=3127014 RepID=A0A934NDU8_9BACT|nr:prenyltransferase [Candidatus Dormibacteraeota bacterium]
MIPASLTGSDLTATVDAIARVQRPDGSIPWYAGGQVDPWNHVEAAMALDVGGRHDEASRAYDWLVRMQRADGSWHAAYRDGAVIDATLDTNLCAYLGTGLWLHQQCGAPDPEVRSIFACLERALGFVLSLQGDDGTVWWACDAAGRPWRRGLVTGSSCVHLSLACAARIADTIGIPHPEWEVARRRLGWALRTAPGSFQDKRRWAMDWYYPVLGGVISGSQAHARIASRWDDFVVPGRGVRCVSDRPWVTAAETCELALALVRCDDRDRAVELLEWAQHLRGDDAAYWTGANFTDGCIFPPDEQPTWTTAAVVLAADAISGGLVATVLDATR